MSDTSDSFLAEHPELLQDDRTSRTAQRVVAALMRPLAAYHGVRSSGWHNVPAHGGCLLIANHNIAAIQEAFILLREWTRNLPERPARGLMHRIAWHAPFKWFPVLQWIGGVFAHPEVARRALARGDALLVFPGGDVQAMRPFQDRYKIDLYGRIGFVRMARETGVPIVPTVLCGAHATYFMLPGAEAVTRFVPLRKWFGVKAFPITAGAVASLGMVAGSLAMPLLWPAALATLAQAAIALPSRIDIEVLPPITVRPDESDEAAAERVRQAMQDAMDRMAQDRVTPWF